MKNEHQHLIAVDVYLERRKTREYVGRLLHEKKYFIFVYNDVYLYKEYAIPLGPDLPFSPKKIRSKTLFPTFEDRIPSKNNPAYAEYCKAVHIDPLERDPLVLVSTLGSKGPSSFIFTPVFENEFDAKELLRFRKELRLTIREFGNIFDFSLATISRIEKNKSTGSEALKRIEIYYRFPEVALYEVQRNGFKINDQKREYLEKILRQKKKSSPR